MRPEHLQLATFIGRSSVNCLLGIEHLRAAERVDPSLLTVRCQTPGIDGHHNDDNQVA